MSVNKVRTLFLTSGWNAIDMPMFEALVESSTRLSFHVFAARRVARIATQRPSCAHIWAHMPNGWQRGLAVGCLPALVNSLFSALIRTFGIGIALALSLLSEAAAIAAETDSAANQFGAHGRVCRNPRGTFRFCGLWLPLQTLVGSLNRRTIMRTA